jgi:V8-like Glu-specific endopeptidase
MKRSAPAKKESGAPSFDFSGATFNGSVPQLAGRDINNKNPVLVKPTVGPSKKARTEAFVAGKACKLEAITGGSDSSLPFSFLQRGAEIGQAVFRIIAKQTYEDDDGEEVAQGDAIGTGFVISKRGCILTNKHVIHDPAFAADYLVAQFFYEKGRRPVEVPFIRNGLFLSSATLDFTVIQIAHVPEQVHPVRLPLRPLKEGKLLPKSHKVNIIGHPDGKEKRVALQDNVVVALNENSLDYKTDTEPGSSGSPVFNNSWGLVALHQRRGDEKDSNGDYTFNTGVRIDRIVSSLRQASADASQLALLGLN